MMDKFQEAEMFEAARLGTAGGQRSIGRTSDTGEIEVLARRVGDLIHRIQGNNARIGIVSDGLFGPAPEAQGEEASFGSPALTDKLSELEREVSRQCGLLDRF